MAKNEFAAVRGRLEAERERLHGDIAALDAEDQQPSDDAGIGNHIADDATDVMNRERNAALRNNANELLAHISAALERIDAGTYGICERCGKPINPERLEALPYATHCITCQAEIERER
ncbi:conjugal transfer protein TraR [Kouleothrix aurantiaca]|jgi:DnaK suppressor protein|uniref:Conjugal transfer protein TraR n=1 Tax=Kouleothrix aurantiaca TaxID=186479 RepID=A0A0P9DAC8_9CHLR|nr:conjugal transfer protein TraR [Kouleothrix aurantiaca]